MMFFCQLAFASSYKEVQFVNRTGYTVSYLSCRDSESDREWGDGFAGSDGIENGASKTINYNAEMRYFDIKMVLADGREYVFPKCDFYEAWRITLSPQGDSFVVWKN